MSAPLRLRLVSTTGSNFFMTELLELVAAGARDLGADARVVLDRFPDGDDNTVYVIIPHEYFETVTERDLPTAGQLRRTVGLCTEQPGTRWFELAFDRLGDLGAVMDLQTVGLGELHRRGVEAEHLPLGYHESWDDWGRDTTRERPVDVLFLGSGNPRRDRLLAGYAPTLWPRHSHIVFATHEAKPAAGPGVLAATEKRRALGEASTMLCVRRRAPAYFEWVRALEAILNGCVVVTEHAAGYSPLIPGEHFISGAPESLALLADGLLRDPDRLEAIRLAAYDAVRDGLPMTAGAERLLAVAADVRQRTPAPPARPTHERLRQEVFTPPVDEPPAPVPDDAAVLRAAAKSILLDSLRTRRLRAVEAARERGIDAPTTPIDVCTTPAYADAAPRVSVLIPAYNHAEEVVETLASIAASEFTDLEVLIHDDGSTDSTKDAVRTFLEARPWLAARLSTVPVNCGLPRARNHLVASARADLLLILDSDNEVWPTTIGRLVATLAADPAAAFAYPILQMHRNDEPLGLRSHDAWDPALLASRNPVDAFALIRRERLQAVGGYTEDPRLHGWEDYDLWCRFAESGAFGIQVPEILGRYRTGSVSMLSLTDVDVSEMQALLRERYPKTMVG